MGTLNKDLARLYRNFRLLQYKSLFGAIRERSGSLSATEAYAADVIYLLGNPTIKQFAECLGISQPNASYKISNLVAKGYVTRVASDDDRREARLQLSDKFYGYIEPGNQLIDSAVSRLEDRYPPEKLHEFEAMLAALNEALEE